MMLKNIKSGNICCDNLFLDYLQPWIKLDVHRGLLFEALEISFSILNSGLPFGAFVGVNTVVTGAPKSY